MRTEDRSRARPGARSRMSDFSSVLSSPLTYLRSSRGQSSLWKKTRLAVPQLLCRGTQVVKESVPQLLCRGTQVVKESVPQLLCRGTQGVKEFVLSERGQLVMPALFVIPSLVLFIYLIYETAKLSREKIRHQFALDTASFVEMTNYSDFLNRTAYCNGAFPARVGYEAFFDPQHELDIEWQNPGNHPEGPTSIYSYLVKAGLLPASPLCDEAAMKNNCPALNDPSLSDWQFNYHGNPRNNTDGRESGNVKPLMLLFDKQFAASTHLYFPLVEMVLKNYGLIYSLLGMVQSSQKSVFERLTKSHYFFSRAYAMNAPGEKTTNPNQFPRLAAVPHSIGGFDSWFMTSIGTDYQVTNFKTQPMDLYVLTTVIGLNSSQGTSPREIRQQYKLDPQNAFRVDLNRLLGQTPFVHCTVEVSGGKIWPGATPRYQVRIYP